MNCKDEDLNAKLYSNRAAAHFNLGKKLIYISYYFFTLFSIGQFAVNNLLYGPQFQKQMLICSYRYFYL